MKKVRVTLQASKDLSEDIARLKQMIAEKERKLEVFKKNLGRKLYTDYQDFMEVQNEKCSEEMCEVFKGKLEQVFWVLKEAGIEFKR